MGKAGRERIERARAAIVEEALALMDAGRLHWADELCGSMRPRNYVSGRGYNGGNRLHLSYALRAHGWRDPRFLTFKQAKKNGLHVRKGEKGTVIEHWKVVGGLSAEGEDDESARVLHGGHPVLVGCWTVFNVEQCEGDVKPLVSTVQHDGDLDATARRIAAASACPVVVAAVETACYRPAADRIEIYPREDSYSVNGWTRTLLHEMVHSTGHPRRLARDIANRFGTPEYAREELVAELGAAFMAAEVGLPAQSETDGGERIHAERHAAYLQSWMGALKDDPAELFRAAAKASAAADYLMARMYPEQAEGEAAA